MLFLNRENELHIPDNRCGFFRASKYPLPRIFKRSMKNFPPFLLVSSLVLSFPFIGIFSGPSAAQRQGPRIQFPLLDNATCRPVTSDTRNLRQEVLERQEDSVAIGRRIYEYSFFMRARGGGYTTLVCQVDTNDFDTLTLQMGIADEAANRSEKITINLYQSGSNISTYDDVQPGDIISTVIDLADSTFSSPGDIAIELLCDQSTGYYGCYLLFVDAELSPTGEYVSHGSNGAYQDALGSQGDSEGQEGVSALDSLNEAVEEVETFIEGVENLFDIF